MCRQMMRSASGSSCATLSGAATGTATVMLDGSSWRTAFTAARMVAPVASSTRITARPATTGRGRSPR